MMEKYANMRGTYFAKHLKMNGVGNLVKKIANSQSTRSLVTNAVVLSKNAEDAVEEAKTKALWKEAEDSVFESASKDENRDTKV